MPEPIVYIDRSRIVEGRFEELERGIHELVGFVEAREPQLISYAFFLDEGSMRMTVVAVHPDSASLEFHMQIAGPEFRKLAACVELTSIEVYGRPSQEVREQLGEKAAMLGESGDVLVQEPRAGFTRLPS